MRILVSFLLIVFVAACTNPPDDTAVEGKPAHHTVDGFRNLYVKDPHKNIFMFWKMKLFGPTQWADHEELAHTVDTRPVDLERLLKPGKDLQVTWLGHSTFLIQKDGVNILTDPIFADRAFSSTIIGPKRYIPHVVDYIKLPKIDYVIISHNHYDHLDEVAVQELGDEPLYLVPLKLKDWFVDLGVDPARVLEFDWWDTANFDKLNVEALPSQHWSARSMSDRRKTLWASWSLKLGEEKLWFAGDTGYNEFQFKEIGEKAGPFDLSLIPIGAYAPRDFMKTYHVNPDEAIRIHKDVKAARSIGMHWGAFPLTAEAPAEPKEELQRQRQLRNMSEDEFSTMVVGETLILTPAKDS